MERISIVQGVERIYGPGLMHYAGCGEDIWAGADALYRVWRGYKHSTGCGEDIWAGAGALYRVWRG